MSRADEMRVRLHGALRRTRLIDPGSYEEARTRVRVRGRIERARVVDRVDSGLWASGIHDLSLEHGERDVVRVLGFGYELTYLFVAPLALEPLARDAVARAGALANCIVSIYDRALDRGADGDFLLSREALQTLAAQATRTDGPLPSAATLAAQLVALYFEDLAKLPFHARHVSVRDALVAAIVRMYEAERQTIGPGHVTRRVLRRKSGLPFVVMGLAGWLAKETVCSRQLRAHRTWLYRCGVFVGWVDDIVDLDRDRRAGHPNQVRDSRLSPNDVEARVENLGRRLQSDWRHLAADSAALQTVLGTCLLSWLGGKTALRDHVE